MQARSRYKFSSGRVFIQVYEPGKRPAAQCRGISYPGARICLGIKSYITCRCALSGFKAETDPGKRLRISKKHDKQLTFIGRVSISASIGYEDFYPLFFSQLSPIRVSIARWHFHLEKQLLSVKNRSFMTTVRRQKSCVCTIQV
jgi:hypothetical protein